MECAYIRETVGANDNTSKARGGMKAYCLRLLDQGDEPRGKAPVQRTVDDVHTRKSTKRPPKDKTIASPRGRKSVFAFDFVRHGVKHRQAIKDGHEQMPERALAPGATYQGR